jgi:hypothetical protein
MSAAEVKKWRLLLLISAGLYILALLSPSLVPDPGAKWPGSAEAEGWQCLLFGPLSWMINLVMIVPWTANVVYFFLAGLSLMPVELTIPDAAGLVPFLIGLSAFAVRTSRGDIETGGPPVPVPLGSGGWLWLGSLLVFAPVLMLRKRKI